MLAEDYPSLGQHRNRRYPTVSLTLDAHDTMTQSLLPLDNADTFKIYDTHTPDTTSDITTGINEEASNGLDVTFTNNTESTIGNYSNFGITYRWDFGDGTIQTVNVGSGQSGDTGSTITHKYTLSNNSVAQDFTGNLQVISDHSNSHLQVHHLLYTLNQMLELTLQDQQYTHQTEVEITSLMYMMDLII